MITKLRKALEANPSVSDWLIQEVNTQSFQAFYVMQKRETTRLVNTLEWSVTVYCHRDYNGVEYVGSSSFVLSHKISSVELTKKIDDAVFAASLIKNKSFIPVIGAEKHSWTERDFEMEPFALMDKIAGIYFAESSSGLRFNSLELFDTKTRTHLFNSRGVDLKKTLQKIMIEAIPSRDGMPQNVELYKSFTYKTIDFDLIKTDAIQALNDVTIRFDARYISGIDKIDVILKAAEAAEFFEALIEDYSYDGVYKHTTDKKIGDQIQKQVRGDRLSIGYQLSSKADAFDKDGVLLQPQLIIDEGKLVSYYGSNQYAQYIGLTPTGIMECLTVAKGTTPVAKMKLQPHIEIIALSGIQIDMYSGYIGGEVRLGVYFDGTNRIPVSGFSFSGNIDASLSDLTLSKETVKLADYVGPAFLKLSGLEII